MCFFFQAEDGIRDIGVTGVQTCALPIFLTIGITLGVLFNPMTGPDTRRWLKEKIFGPEEFEYGGSAGATGAGSTGTSTNARSEERRVGKECRSRWWPYP